MPITVDPFTSPTLSTNFPVGGNQSTWSVDFYSSHEDWVEVALRKFSLRPEPAALEVEGKCTNCFASEAPIFLKMTSSVLYYKAKHKLKYIEYNNKVRISPKLGQLKYTGAITSYKHTVN
jgi:hypothetical protein